MSVNTLEGHESRIRFLHHCEECVYLGKTFCMGNSYDVYLHTINGVKYIACRWECNGLIDGGFDYVTPEQASRVGAENDHPYVLGLFAARARGLV